MKTHMAALCFLLALCGSVALTEAAGMRVGVASTDVTPPLGIGMAGYYHERGADGVLDPLASKAVVIEVEGERVALVAVDILGITRAIVEQARANIEQTTGIKGANVMITATHAHTGPELANRTLNRAKQSNQQASAIIYTEKLPKLIAESVRTANGQLQPARASAAHGRCENLAFNRRYYMRDGSVHWNPGKMNPDAIRAAGPTDPEVGILYIEPEEGRTPAQAIATYVNFAMHPDTTGGSKFSADWPGALSRVLSTYHGSNHLTLVANGACGNLNHFDVFSSWPNSGPFERNRIGTILGAAVFQGYRELKPLGAGPLRVQREIVELALPEITPVQIEEARQIAASTKDDRGANFMKLVRANRALEIAEREGRPLQAEVQVITLGRDAAWVGLPGEVFVELGLSIKKQSPFPYTFVVELANDTLGYIPDRRSYAEGAYEPESSRCAPGSGEKLVETAVKLLKAAAQ
jgi:hypothetical protein